MLNENILRTTFGFNDPNVINAILTDPVQRNRYEREAGIPTSTPEGNFAFDFETEIDRAYSDLGEYYNRLLEESRGDVNLALARLNEDYQTGERYRKQDFGYTRQALDLAQQGLTADANQILRANERNLLQRGISRASAFDPTGARGIADVQTQRVQRGIERAQEGQELRSQQAETAFERAGEQATTGLQRGEEDLNRALERQESALDRERKKEASNLALTRAQRAFQRFESDLF